MTPLHIAAYTPSQIVHLMPSVKSDRRRRDYEPKTPFQKWLKPLLEDRDWTYTDLAQELQKRGVDVTENHIYRIVRGDPEKFASAKRPGYDLTVSIGEIVGDRSGAVTSAGYKSTSERQEMVLSSGDRVRLIYRAGDPGTVLDIDDKTLAVLIALAGGRVPE